MVKKTLLDNGICFVSEQMRNMRSVSLGIWVQVGSRNEPTQLNGISHFAEHMFFKGTKKHNTQDIAIVIDSLGGELNAFTSKECTTFYVKVLDEHIDKAADLLLDIFLHSTFPEDEVEREKGVIKEEIKMVEDTPDDYIHDLFSMSVWGNSGLGQPVLGTRETVKSFNRQSLADHIHRYYGTADTIVSCAGNFDEALLLKRLNKGLGKLRRATEPPMRAAHTFIPNVEVHQKDLCETHICMGLKGIPQTSKDRYLLSLVNTIFGGGLSSRLFQEIREKRGLAYSIYSFVSSYKDDGMWGVYAGAGRKKAPEVMERIAQEFVDLPKNITKDVLKRAKDQLKGNLMLGLESTSRRMQNIANQQIYYGRNYSPKEMIAEIDKVTLKQARTLTEAMISSEGLALTVLGPMDKNELPTQFKK